MSHSLGCSALCCNSVYTTLYKDMKQWVWCIMKWWRRVNCGLARLGLRQCECRPVGVREEVHSCFRHSTEQLAWCECALSASASSVVGTTSKKKGKDSSLRFKIGKSLVVFCKLSCFLSLIHLSESRCFSLKCFHDLVYCTSFPLYFFQVEQHP